MMEVCVNNNAASGSNYDWAHPCQTSPSAPRPKRDFRFQVIEVCQGPKWFIWPSRNRGSHDEIDVNHNKEPKTTDTGYDTASSSCPAQNGYGAMRRTVLRGSKRKQDIIDVPSRTSSEPASRRLSLKKEKACTEPLTSNTFKILSIAKKWESFDVTDEEQENELSASCQTLRLSDHQ